MANGRPSETDSNGRRPSETSPKRPSAIKVQCNVIEILKLCVILVMLFVLFQGITKVLNDAKKLQNSLEMLDRIGSTRTDKVMFECNSTPRKRTAQSSTCSPLREHLSRLNRTPTPLRTSARLSEKDKLRNRKLVSAKGYTLRNLPLH